MSDAVMVPREPTEAMIAAGSAAAARCGGWIGDGRLIETYKAMLAASTPVGGWEDAVTAMYVPMPLNASGDGPADADETVRIEHQVWDAETCGTLCIAADEGVARWIVSLINAAPPPSSVSTGSRPQEAILPQTEKGS